MNTFYDKEYKSSDSHMDIFRFLIDTAEENDVPHDIIKDIKHLDLESLSSLLNNLKALANELGFSLNLDLAKKSLRPESLSYSRIAQALSQDYYSIYYVDTETDRFIEYSSQSQYQELQVEQSGEDFFNDCRRNIMRVVHPEDRDKALSAFDKRALLRELENNGTYSITYRLMFDGEPVYVNIKVIRLADEGDSKHIIIGISNVDAQIKRQQEYEAAKKESVTYSRISLALSQDYFGIYYINSETDNYIEYSSNSQYQSLEVQGQGKDFFRDCVNNIRRLVYPEDQEAVIKALRKKTLLRALEDGTFSMSYRLMFNGVPVYINLKAIWMESEDSKHIVIGISNVDAQVRRQQELEKEKAQSLTYSRIAQALSQDYFGIYYINSDTDEYVEYSSNSKYQELEIQDSGDDFFEDCPRNIKRLLYPEDQDRVIEALKKENLMRALEDNGIFSMTYRLMLDGVPVYIALKAIWLESEVNKHIVIGIRNIDAQKKQEAEYALALGHAREIANKDPLTGVKSKHAYNETEKELNELISNHETDEFAVVVCDVNGLKAINDTLGHKAGDQYIQDACSVICAIFKHSPVFRIGGDEFAVILQGHDYTNRDALMTEMDDIVRLNKKIGDVIIACGMSEYAPAHDTELASVFERADSAMYINKKALKEEP